MLTRGTKRPHLLEGQDRRVARTRSKSNSVESELGAPPGLRATRFFMGADELVVLSFPLASVEFPASLSAAERAVAFAVIEGKSSEVIAAERRTSVRTVANQIASLFRKLRVHSRGELVAAVCRAPRR